MCFLQVAHRLLEVLHTCFFLGLMWARWSDACISTEPSCIGQGFRRPRGNTCRENWPDTQKPSKPANSKSHAARHCILTSRILKPARERKKYWKNTMSRTTHWDSVFLYLEADTSWQACSRVSPLFTSHVQAPDGNIHQIIGRLWKRLNSGIRRFSGILMRLSWVIARLDCVTTREIRVKRLQIITMIWPRPEQNCESLYKSNQTYFIALKTYQQLIFQFFVSGHLFKHSRAIWKVFCHCGDLE